MFRAIVTSFGSYQTRRTDSTHLDPIDTAVEWYTIISANVAGRNK